MIQFGTLIFLLAGLAATVPTASMRSNPVRPPAWGSWQPSRGPWKSRHDGVPSDVPAEALMEQIQANYSRSTRARIQTLDSECSESTALRRKEWGSLQPEERLAYISAAGCLAALPAKTTSEFAPGAKSRWDDFTVAHMINTREIHLSAWLLPWHRHFIWEMEQALRNECGYDAALPYWDWAKYIYQPLEQNPVFDLSATSLSGNGTTVSENCTIVDSGPLANWTVNLGPTGQNDPFCKFNPRADGLGYNPRPLERRFAQDQNLQFQTTNEYQNITDVILHYSNVIDMNLRIDNGTRGLHGPPHLFIGGLNSDTYASPGDPAFYLHHAQLDRVWSLWQSYDFDVRESDVGFTTGFDDTIRGPVFGWPPAPYVDLNSTLYLSPWFENSTAGESMSTLKGKYCYVYE